MINILIINLDSPMHVLFSTPLIRTLKENYPDAKIDFVCDKASEPIIQNNPHLNTIFTYNKEELSNMPFFKKTKAEKEFFAQFENSHYHIVISLTKSNIASHIAKNTNAPTKIGKNIEKNFLLKNVFNIELKTPGRQHLIEYYLEPATYLNLHINSKKLEVYEIKNSVQIKENFIQIHPFSKEKFGCINAEKIAEIIDFVENELGEIVIITSPEGEEYEKKTKEILIHCESNPINLANKLKLKDLISINKSAKLFIGVNSTAMHISTANDIAVVGFFGPDEHFYKGPWDINLQESTYKTTNEYQTMGKHKVFIDYKTEHCIENIDTNRVTEEIQESFNKYNNS